MSQEANRFHYRLIFIEVFLVFSVSFLVSMIRFQNDFHAVLFEYPGQPKVLIYPLIWLYLLSVTHAWDRSRPIFSNEFYTSVIIAGIKSTIAFATIAFLLKYSISRIWVIANSLSICLVILAFRLVLKRVYLSEYVEKGEFRYIFVGSVSDEHKVAEELASYFGFKFELVQIDPPKTNGDIREWFKGYQDKVNSHRPFGVVIGYAAITDASLLKLISNYKRTQVIDLILVSRISTLLSRFDNLENPTLVRIRESSLTASGRVPKRAIDLLVSIPALVLLSPLFLLIAILIKLTSRGSVLYVDERVGMKGSFFRFPKFRTMYQGSDQARLNVLGRPDSTMIDRYKSDPRITPLGRFLRRWSLDELPQLWCVMTGKMSLVGPRPILKEEIVQVPNEFETRFIAKPGLTGLWQVTGRKEVSWEDRLLRDIAYIEEWSFARDLVYLAKTITAIISGKGAM